MIVVIDFITFLISLVMMGSVFLRYKKVDTLFLLLELAVTMNCMGRFMISTADNLETAIWANKFLYIGGSYAPILFVCLLFKLSNIKFPKMIATVLALYSSVVLFFVMTAEKNKLYYKEMTLVKAEGGYSYLDKTYGPMHALYTGMMVFYAVIIILFLILGIKMHHKLTYRSIIGLSIAGFGIMVLYVVEKVLELKTSFLSVGYLVGMLYLIRYFDRLNMYDISANIISSVEQRGEYGYVVFDNKLRYISSNGHVKEIFPEIKDWLVDRVVPPCDSELYVQVVDYFMSMDWKDGKNKIVPAGEKYYEVSIRHLSNGKKQIGYLIELVDRTIEQKYYNSIENYNAVLEKEVAAQTKNILYIKDMMVLGMADMVESRDNNTGGHIKRTSAIVRVFSQKLMEYSQQLGLDEKFLRQVEKAAPMHDLGKIAIDDNILRKPGKFTDEEYAEMKRHTTEGAKIVTSILQGVEDDEFVKIARNVALYHHEKYNGKGYPHGISGEDIPVEARIMALADVFDALVSVRCYKKAFTFDEAFDIIKKDLGEHFDPQLGRIFIECREDLEEIMPQQIGEGMEIVPVNATEKSLLQLFLKYDDFMIDFLGDDKNLYSRYDENEGIEKAWVVNCEGSPIGCVAFRRKDETVGEVKRLYIEKNYRGRGISKELLKKVEKYAKGQGCETLFLDTRITLEPAVSLYRSYGFEMIFQQDLYIQMEKKI